MKKILFSALFLGIVCSIQSQSWIKSNLLYGDGDIIVINSTQDSENSVILLGYYQGTLNATSGESITSRGGRDYFVAKLDNDANVIWLKTLGSPLSDYFDGGICVDNADAIYVTGGFRDYLLYSPTDSIQSTGLDDIFIVKYNPDGSAVWGQNAGKGARNQRPTSIEYESGSGNLLMAGIYIDSIEINDITTLYQDNAFKDYYYAKYDTDGNNIWVKRASSLNTNYSGRIQSIITDNDSYYFAGVFADSIGFENDTIVAIGTELYDIHLIKTDSDGNIDWIRVIGGDAHDNTYSVTLDPDNNIYISGYYSSTDLTVDSDEGQTILVNDKYGSYDYLVAKYDPNGVLDWIETAGGKGDDRLADAAFFNNQINVSGYFTDTLYWGGIQLTTEGSTADKDMFVGSLDTDGNFRNANSYAGRNNSVEDTRSIFGDLTNLYTVIRSNSDQLILGDSIYIQSGDYYYVSLGIIGCLPISIDNTVYDSIKTCYGDSTGYILVSATGGFEGPWQYSIDNGLNYSNDPYYGNLPAGEYQVVVIDKEGCSKTGELVRLGQPDTLLATVSYHADILHHTDWLGVVDSTQGALSIAASGGSGSGPGGAYSYQLLPGGNPIWGDGNFFFNPSDSGRYVVAVNDNGECGPSETDTVDMVVMFSDEVGIEGFDGVEVKIYPNPTSGIITLELPFDKDEASLDVMNMSGQVVHQQIIFPSSGVINETIDLSKVPKGLYLLRIDGRSLNSAIVVK